MRGWMVATLIALGSCGDGNVGTPPSLDKQGACTPELCKEICEPAADGTDPPASGGGTSPSAKAMSKSEIERRAMEWIQVEVRKGVRPYSDEAIGLCRGKKACDKFLGPDAGKLGRGTFFVRAQLRVPPGPQGMWKVAFRTDCAAAGGETKTFEREYDVAYAGPDAPFELTNLRTIENPSEDGAQECKYTLTTTDAGGATTKYTGFWATTAKE